jgi:hypothetical protein
MTESSLLICDVVLGGFSSLDSVFKGNSHVCTLRETSMRWQISRLDLSYQKNTTFAGQIHPSLGLRTYQISMPKEEK